VAYDSPLGKALLGAEEGDLCDVVLAGRSRKVEILEVGPTPAGADAIDLAMEAA
jgi:transcription elongation GreA/GreB family factor